MKCYITLSIYSLITIFCLRISLAFNINVYFPFQNKFGVKSTFKLKNPTKSCVLWADKILAKFSCVSASTIYVHSHMAFMVFLSDGSQAPGMIAIGRCSLQLCNVQYELNLLVSYHSLSGHIPSTAEHLSKFKKGAHFILPVPIVTYLCQIKSWEMVLIFYTLLQMPHCAYKLNKICICNFVTRLFRLYLYHIIAV